MNKAKNEPNLKLNQKLFSISELDQLTNNKILVKQGESATKRVYDNHPVLLSINQFDGTNNYHFFCFMQAHPYKCIREDIYELFTQLVEAKEYSCRCENEVLLSKDEKLREQYLKSFSCLKNIENQFAYLTDKEDKRLQRNMLEIKVLCSELNGIDDLVSKKNIIEKQILDLQILRTIKFTYGICVHEIDASNKKMLQASNALQKVQSGKDREVLISIIKMCEEQKINAIEKLKGIIPKK